MPRILDYNLFEPQLQFRYTMYIDGLPGSIFYAKSAQQPKYSHNPVELAYGNHKFYDKGRTTWEPITVTCYQFTRLTLTELRIYYSKLQINQDTAIDSPDRSTYLRDFRLILMDPMKIPAGTWVLKNAFISDADFGDMTWQSDADLAEVTLTITYDYASFQPI